MNRNLMIALGLGAVALTTGCSTTQKTNVSEEEYGMLVQQLGLSEKDMAADLGLDLDLDQYEYNSQIAINSEVRTELSPSEKSILLKVDHIKQATTVIQQNGRIFLVSDPDSFVIDDWDDKND